MTLIENYYFHKYYIVYGLHFHFSNENVSCTLTDKKTRIVKLFINIIHNEYHCC